MWGFWRPNVAALEIWNADVSSELVLVEVHRCVFCGGQPERQQSFGAYSERSRACSYQSSLFSCRAEVIFCSHPHGIVRQHRLFSLICRDNFKMETSADPWLFPRRSWFFSATHWKPRERQESSVPNILQLHSVLTLIDKVTLFNISKI